MRRAVCLLLLLVTEAAVAKEGSHPYYGPKLGLLKGNLGYQEKSEKDGGWRVIAKAKTGEDSLSIAMYRAAELTRAQGYEYVQFLSGWGRRSAFEDSAVVSIRPSHDPAPPTACHSKKPGSCYTADVAELLRVLGGPDGIQPGVPITDHVDEYGRAVSFSGFGIAKASMTPPRTVPDSRWMGLPALTPQPHALGTSTVSPAAIATTAPHTAVSVRVGSRSSSYERLQKAEQGVRGREPKQGWTISD